MRSPIFTILSVCFLGATGDCFGEVNTKANPGIAEAVAAARQGDITRLISLHGAGVSFEERDPVSGLTPPEGALLAGRTETVQWFRGWGFDGKFDLPELGDVGGRWMRARVDADGPGVVVLVAKGERVLLRAGYGMADLQRGEAVGPDTVFRVGSITKQFTATAVMLLAQEGKLGLDDKLQKFFPDFPRGDQITLRHLLAHTSGLPNFTSKSEFDTRVLNPMEPGELIDWLVEDGFEFDPGAGWFYSNSGYFLLGQVVGKVAGVPLEEYLEIEVFEPLEMRRTGFVRTEMELEGEALGYAHEDGEVEPAPDWDMSWLGGAGAMYSTVDDLYRWNRAIFGGEVLSAENLLLAHEPGKIGGGIHLGEEGGEYGYGWRIEDYRGRKVIGHSGGVAGFLSHVSYFPADDLTVVVLSNSSPAAPGTAPEEIWKGLADLFLYQTLTPLGSFREGIGDVETVRLEDYEGTFDFKLLGTLRVSLENGELRAQMSTQQEVVLKPQGADTFYYADGDAEFRFFRDEADSVSEVRLVQAGFRIRAERYTEPDEVELPGEVLRRYVGDYDLGTGVLVVRVGGDGGLTAKIGDQPALPIYPCGGAEFFWKAGRARVEFETDPETGQVVLARHRQGGVTSQGRRVIRQNSGGVSEQRGDAGNR